MRRFIGLVSKFFLFSLVLGFSINGWGSNKSVENKKPHSDSAISRDLYVSTAGSDINPGTKTSPLRSILQASKLAKPGTTIHVAPGVYPGGFKTTASGTETARIRYISTKKWGAKIVPPARSENIGAWENMGNYVDIDGFEIDGTEIQEGKEWWHGIATGGSYTRITNNHVHHIANKESDCQPRGGAGISTTGYFRGSNHVVEQNVVHHIGPNKPCNKIHGVYIGAPTASVKNNLVYRISYGAVHLWHDAQDVEIVNNTLFNSEYGIIVGGSEPYFTSGVNDNTLVVNNIIFDCKYGVFEMGKTGPNNVYTNNLVAKIKIKPWALNVTPRHAINSDPKFVNYIANGGGDYRLKPDSPAKGQGTSSYAPAIDLNGVARTKKGYIDLGAYQS